MYANGAMNHCRTMERLSLGESAITHRKFIHSSGFILVNIPVAKYDEICVSNKTLPGVDVISVTCVVP